MKQSRRNFIRCSAGATALAAVPGIISSCSLSGDNKNKLSLTNNSVILFQGDSITDAGREKNRELANNAQSFGQGYAFLAASQMLEKLAEKQLNIYNRGISGNKVHQLADRWDKDCLALKPDVLSILIGVNDYWHTRGGNYNGTVEIYENDYRELLKRTKQDLPNVQLVLCGPFYILETTAVDESWIEPMKKYQAAARKIADEFDALWVPFQKVFDEAIKHADGKYWAADGVQPTMAGSQLMAQAWLKVVGL